METIAVGGCQASPSREFMDKIGCLSLACASPFDQTPMLSAEVFIVPLGDDRHLVYAPLRRAAFMANGGVVQLLAEIQQGTFNAGIDADGAMLEFLRRLEIIDAGDEARPITEFKGDPEPTTVTLFLTTACNLRCTYCYAAAGDTPTKLMPLEIAMRGIDFVAANAKKKGAPVFEIAFHGGGEPTVNWRVMLSSLDYARTKASELGLQVLASSATNGVLKDDQVDWVIANLAGASVSFDGLPAVHDHHRPTVSGKGSSERVIHTIRRFDAAGFPYGLRVTVTADQIPMMAESIEFICANFRPKRIQVEPAYQIGRWSNAPSAETEGFIAGYREAQERASRYGRERR